MSSTQNSAEFSTGDDSQFVNAVRSNIKSDIIVITDDKLKVILQEYLDLVKNGKDLMGPLSLVITTFLACATANFTDTFGIPIAIWDALFKLALIASGVWLLWQVTIFVKNRKKNSIDFLINEIKNSNSDQKQ